MPVLPNTTYMESRRCSERRYFLRPNKTCKQIYEYCLAVAAQKYSVEVHGYCVESNHEHEETTDVLGNHPAFRQYKNSLIARAMNTLLKRREAFWSPTDRDVTEVIGAEAQAEAYAYVLANPVKDGLVKHGHQWPGARSRPEELGSARIIKRPHVFFAQKEMPEEVELRLTVPPALRALPQDDAIKKLGEAVAAKEARARQARERNGVPFLGRRAVRKLNPFDRPNTEAPFRRLNPRIKCAEPDQRKAALEKLRAFWIAHEAARQKYLGGVTTVLFPRGTFHYRRMLGVAVEPP